MDINKKSEYYVNWILATRDVDKIRFSLRYGDSPQQEYKSYPHLTKFWVEAPYLKTPILLHSTVISTYPNIKQESGRPLGAALKLSTYTGGSLTEENIGKRLLSLQKSELVNAHKLMRPLFSALNSSNAKLNFYQLFALYSNWDHPNIEIAQRHRRSLIEQFYSK